MQLTKVIVQLDPIYTPKTGIKARYFAAPSHYRHVLHGEKIFLKNFFRFSESQCIALLSGQASPIHRTDAQDECHIEYMTNDTANNCTSTL